MDSLEQLSLTDKDFDMLVEGLEALTNKDAAKDLVSDIMIGLLAQGNKALEQRLAMEKKRQQQGKEADLRVLNEDVKILQGKLILLKRYLLEQGALTEVRSVLGKKS